MGVIGNNVKTYKIDAVSGSAQDIDGGVTDGIDIASSIKLITAGSDVHVVIGKGDATVSDYLLMQNVEVNFDVTQTRVSAITEGSSSAVYVAITY
jgi:hypothetical protein